PRRAWPGGAQPLPAAVRDRARHLRVLGAAAQRNALALRGDFVTSTGPSGAVPDNKARTSVGLDANVAAAVAYGLGWIPGLALLLMEHQNRFVRFHALQSIIVFGALSFAWFLCFSVPLFGWLVSLFIIPPVSAGPWVPLMVKGHHGQRLQLPT